MFCCVWWTRVVAAGEGAGDDDGGREAPVAAVEGLAGQADPEDAPDEGRDPEAGGGREHGEGRQATRPARARRPDRDERAAHQGDQQPQGQTLVSLHPLFALESRGIGLVRAVFDCGVVCETIGEMVIHEVFHELEKFHKFHRHGLLLLTLKVGCNAVLRQLHAL